MDKMVHRQIVHVRDKFGKEAFSIQIDTDIDLINLQENKVKFVKNETMKKLKEETRKVIKNGFAECYNLAIDGDYQVAMLLALSAIGNNTMSNIPLYITDYNIRDYGYIRIPSK